VAAEHARESEGLSYANGATRLSDALRGAARLARYRRIGIPVAAMTEPAGGWP